MTNALGTVRQTSLLTVTHGDAGGDPTTGIIIIAVVCCVLGTSCVWVQIIYHTRRATRREDRQAEWLQELHTQRPLLGNNELGLIGGEAVLEHGVEYKEGEGERARRRDWRQQEESRRHGEPGKGRGTRQRVEEKRKPAGSGTTRDVHGQAPSWAVATGLAPWWAVGPAPWWAPTCFHAASSSPCQWPGVAIATPAHASPPASVISDSVMYCGKFPAMEPGPCLHCGELRCPHTDTDKVSSVSSAGQSSAPSAAASDQPLSFQTFHPLTAPTNHDRISGSSDISIPLAASLLAGRVELLGGTPVTVNRLKQLQPQGRKRMSVIELDNGKTYLAIEPNVVSLTEEIRDPARDASDYPILF